MEVIHIEHLSKLYRLGQVGTGTLSHDLNRWWAQMRGKEDPFTKVGKVNDRAKAAGKDEYVWALQDVNIKINQGEVVGIIGKNGAGKSTLLKILSRITSPTKGDIKIKGRVAALLEVGTGFHPEMTGRENIYMNGTVLGMRRKEIDRKLEEIVEFAGVAKYIDTPVKRFSSGMTVRLGFAVAAHLDPEILVVDEVLAVGDAEFQKKAIGKMHEVSQTGGRTVLFVSHNMDSIQSLCSRVILMENGTVGNDGDTRTIIDYYINKQEVFDVIESSGIIIDDFRIYYHDGDKKTESFNVPFGHKITFEFNVAIRNFDISDKLYFALTIRNRFGQKITTLDNLYAENPVNIKSKNKIRVTCDVNSNYLIPSDYSIEMWCGSLFETYIKDQKIGKLEIVFSNYFGNGKLHSEKQHGSFLLPNEWHQY